MAMAGWVAMDGTVALSPSAVFRSAARCYATHNELAAKHLWLTVASAMMGNRVWE
jgi:hypothetical protein